MRPDPTAFTRSVRLPLALALGLLLVAGCGAEDAAAPSAGSSDAPSEAPSDPSSDASAGATRTPSPEEQSPATDLPPNPDADLTCGAAYTTKKPRAFAVTGQFPSTAPRGAEVMSGTVELVTGRGITHGVVTREAQAFLVRDGRVVTMPVPQDFAGRAVELGDGAVARLPANVSLVGCADGERLEPGRYDLYARVLLNRDGPRVEAVGGPWPLEVP